MQDPSQGFMVGEFGQYFMCPKCGVKSYKYKKDLNRHLKLECGVSPKFTCGICGKKYKRKETLKQHATIHQRQGYMPAQF